MGFNAVVVVLTDRLTEIERDPEFGKKLVAAIRYRCSRAPKDCEYDPREPYVTGQTQVIGVNHANYMTAYVVGGNTGRYLGLGGSYRVDNSTIIKNLEQDRRREIRDAKRRGEKNEAASAVDTSDQSHARSAAHRGAP